MIGLEDRIVLAQDIDTAHRNGARLERACAERTLQRWKTDDGSIAGDRRPGAKRPTPAHALSAKEREKLLRVANEPRFADMPPARIVPALADEGVYLASESTLALSTQSAIRQSPGSRQVVRIKRNWLHDSGDNWLEARGVGLGQAFHA
jgi:hypothetical protein